MDVDEASEACERVLTAVERAVIADRSFLADVLVGILASGHVLVEDVPGTGKTLAARTFADALGLSFSRVQFTPDLLPADVTGTHVFNERTGEFEFNEGPVFANVVLADEINRAPPKTQSALLETMEEGQVTADGETHELPAPFFVLATQNPVEHEGTFALPEAQVDRFMIKTRVGYPDREGERELLRRRGDRETRAPPTETVLSPGAVGELQRVRRRPRRSSRRGRWGSSSASPRRCASRTTFSSTCSTSRGRHEPTGGFRSASRRGVPSGSSRPPGPGQCFLAGPTSHPTT